MSLPTPATRRRVHCLHPHARTTSTEVIDKAGQVIQVKHIDALDSLPEVGRQFPNFNAPANW